MPTGTPSISAASAYDRPSTWVSANALRRSAGSRPSRSAAPRCRPGSGSGAVGFGRQPGVEPAAADHRAEMVGAGPPGDAEQPGAGARPALEPGQRPERPQVGLLGQIVRGVRIDQRGGEPPHLGLGLPHERRLRRRIARPGGERPTRGRLERRRGRERTLGWYHGNPGYADRAPHCRPTPVRVARPGIVGTFRGSRPTTRP